MALEGQIQGNLDFGHCSLIEKRHSFDRKESDLICVCAFVIAAYRYYMYTHIYHVYVNYITLSCKDNFLTVLISMDYIKAVCI